MSQDLVDKLVSLLDLEAIEVDIFRGVKPYEDRQRVFGGQVAGQALVAAARTVEPHLHVHSLHAYFLRGGDPSVPILYLVDRLRDGRSFSTRRVVAVQHGKPIFNLSASFHKDEPGMEHQAPPPDNVPYPEALPDFRTMWEPFRELLGDWYDLPRPIDTRYVDWKPIERAHPLAAQQRVWMRADGHLPDDPIVHTCVLTYASDMTLVDTTLLPHGGEFDRNHMILASLDHAMWFHRPFRADEWLLYVQDTPSASRALGLARGLIYTQDGELVGSVVQEGLIRKADR